MRRADVEVETVDDLEGVFSELVANAVAASATMSNDVRVRAQLADGMLVLEVSNRRERADDLPVSVPDGDDTLRENGRGLLIARAYVDSVNSEPQLPDRFLLRCSRRLAHSL